MEYHQETDLRPAVLLSAAVLVAAGCPSATAVLSCRRPALPFWRLSRCQPPLHSRCACCRPALSTG